MYKIIMERGRAERETQVAFDRARAFWSSMPRGLPAVRLMPWVVKPPAYGVDAEWELRFVQPSERELRAAFRTVEDLRDEGLL